jgi:uncharacterized membrane-anchored protein
VLLVRAVARAVLAKVPVAVSPDESMPAAGNTAGGPRRVPTDHPQRVELNDEVHARPPEALVAPARLSCLALLTDAADRERERRHLAGLVERFGGAPPERGASHFSVDLGPFRLKWERHTEFSRYVFIVAASADEPFARTALDAVPADWVQAMPGQVMVAAHGALVTCGTEPPAIDRIAARDFAGNVLVGAGVADDAAVAFTDFRIQADGFSRVLVLDGGLAPRQAGRIFQRLFEIDTYRVMALLALPVARDLSPFLAECERELAEITAALVTASPVDEGVLLERLTRLEASIESRESTHNYRFSAAAAYYELVQRRIQELRESRLQGLQTFQEFTERRLAPAMNTCRSVALRLESLSQRVARTTQLLSTRVDLTRERQNQALLESMNRRAELQLHLQSTVEGLSVAAITYYVVGLVFYAAKATERLNAAIDPNVVTAVSIPFVLIFVALGVRRVRRLVARRTGA